MIYSEQSVSQSNGAVQIEHVGTDIQIILLIDVV